MNKDIPNTVDEEDDVPPTDGYNHHTREEELKHSVPVFEELAEDEVEELPNE